MKYITTFIFCLLTKILLAQEIEIKKDIVYLDNEPAFKINGGALSTTFSIENMNGKKLIFFKVDNENKNANGTAPYIVSFAGYPGLTASFQGSIPFKKSIAKEIVSNDLLADNELNEENVLRYCGASVPKTRNRTLTLAGAAYTPVERNTSAPFFAAGGEIKQDFKLIGKFQINTSHDNGKQLKTIKISGSKNERIAVVNYYAFSEFAEMRLANQSDSMEINIPNANELKVLEYIIQYLIDDAKL